MNVQTITPVDLKQQIHQVVEQLPEEQLPDMLHFSETLLNGNRVNGVNGANGAGPVQSQLANQTLETEHPWMKFAGVFKDDPDWDEFLECLAEVRREANQIEDYEIT